MLHAVAETGGAWREEVEVVGGIASGDRLARLADLLGGPVPTATVPPMWTTVVTPMWPARSTLGPDGHPATGVGYPPLTDRRRLFAGGRFQLHAGLPVDGTVERRSSVIKVRAAEGRSGPLLFVTVEHRYVADGHVLVAVEEHDLAYRSGPGPAAAAEPVREEATSADVAVLFDAVALFRFSVLTGNSHRIHYDEEYARNVEGLPGRLVHGPLLALLLLEAPRRLVPERTVASFSFRVNRPVVVDTAVGVRHVETGDGVWTLTATADGLRCAAGEVVFGTGAER